MRSGGSSPRAPGCRPGCAPKPSPEAGHSLGASPAAAAGASGGKLTRHRWRLGGALAWGAAAPPRPTPGLRHPPSQHPDSPHPSPSTVLHGESCGDHIRFGGAEGGAGLGEGEGEGEGVDPLCPSLLQSSPQCGGEQAIPALPGGRRGGSEGLMSQVTRCTALEAIQLGLTPKASSSHLPTASLPSSQCHVMCRNLPERAALGRVKHGRKEP